MVVWFGLTRFSTRQRFQRRNVFETARTFKSFAHERGSYSYCAASSTRRCPEISRIENLEHLTCLTKLNLSCNRLGPAPRCLDGLANLTRLRELDMSDNNM